MPYCCVPKCRRSRVTHPGLSFYTFPKNEKTKKRWMANIRRANWEPTIHSVVCSWHFPNGPEYPPTRFEWNETKRLNFFSPEKRKSSKKLHEPVQESASHDNLSEVVTCSKCCEKDEEIARLKMKVESLSNELCQAKMQSKFELIKAKDELVYMYTGLPASAVTLLVSLLSRFQLKNIYGWSVACITLTDQVFLTLMKLRLNMPTLDLASRFNCSVTTVSNIFITITAALHEILFEYFMSAIPSTNKNRACMPECFSSFCNCRLIMDCTEIYISVPRESMNLQRATYSHYKSPNTFKALVCVAPNGIVVFASKLYAGSAADKDIVHNSQIAT